MKWLNCSNENSVARRTHCDVVATTKISYASAKVGLIGFSKSIARENAKFGVTLNVFCPAPVQEASVESTGGKMLDLLKGQTWVGRLCESEGVAVMAIFLAGGLAACISGEVIGVSSGNGRLGVSLNCTYLQWDRNHPNL